MASPIFQMRLDPEQRARWMSAAGAEQSLADFIKECVEEKIARAVEPDAPRVPRPPVRRGRPEGSSVFKGMDPKGGKAKK